MKKTLKVMMAVFAVAFGMMLFSGTTKAATISGLRQTDASTSSINLSWNAVLGNPYYVVYFSNDGKTGWTKMSYVTSSPSAYIYSLSEGSCYYAKVAAYSDYSATNVLGESGVIRVSTVPNVPEVQGLKQTKATANSITMAWTAVSGASSYEVYRYNSYNNYTKVGTTTKTSFTAGGLSASTEAQYFVIAYKRTAAGVTGKSRYYTAKKMYTVPAKVSLISMTYFWSNLNEGKYEWNSVNGASGYRFQLQNYKGKNLLTKEVSSNYIYVKPYKKGVFTKAKVQPYLIINNHKYYGPWSSYNYNASSKKVTLKRSANRKKITVKWKKISGASGYTVYVSTKSGSGYKKVKSLGKKKTSCTIKKCGKKKLSKKKTYYVRVVYKTKAGKKTINSGIRSEGSI